MLASTKDSDTAGPAWWAAISPVREKIPAPTVQPTPKAVRLTTPSERRRREPRSANASVRHDSRLLREAAPMEPSYGAVQQKGGAAQPPRLSLALLRLTLPLDALQPVVEVRPIGCAKTGRLVVARASLPV